MAEKKSKKEKSFMDKMTDIFIVLVIIAAICFIGALIAEKYSADKAEKKQDGEKTEQTAKEPEETPLPEGVVRYNNVISSGSANNDTEFFLLFNYNDGTYQEKVRAAKLEDSLDEGTFEETDDTIKTVSKVNDGLEEVYLVEGDFIIPESALFEGEVGDKDTFEAECVLESKDYTTTISFYKGGTYREERKAKTEGVEDTVKGGVYERKDGYIKRTSEEGEALLDLYIYKNRIANAYYKKES